MLVALALASAVAGPAAPAEPVAPLPLEVQGQLDAPTRQQLSEQLVEGLRRGAFEVRPLPPQTAAPCPIACMAGVRDATGVEHLVRAQVSVDDRVYRIRVELLDATGAVVVETEASCEVCGRRDVAEMMASQGSALARRWDLLQAERAQAPPPPRPPPAGLGTGDPIRTPPPVVDAAPPDPLRPLGGVAMGIGATTAVAGIVLLALHGRPYRSRCTNNDIDAQGECRFLYDTALGGGLSLAGGAAMLAAGVTLLVLAKRRRTRAQPRALGARWGLRGH